MNSNSELMSEVISFWQWFKTNLNRFHSFEDHQAELMEELGERLYEVDDGLTFELSVLDTEGVRDLVISADGIQDSFPAVLALTENAPDLPGWTFTPFRQRIDVTQFGLQFGDRELNANDFYFWLQTEEGAIDLILFAPDLTEENREEMMGAAFILLDMTLGEFDVTLNLRYIDFQPLPEDPEAEELQPLPELPAAFDALYSALYPEEE
ncbi:hypothetical protein Pan241w_60000 [Gimesia alba]|uniref:DUF695 domain-containing protein n=1 Tax=Gimesia alba TaxID=2527973 RepID=A0A517RPV3_9PLAN|nr:hypothetical protein [Gimesia alba]QDT45872.1 hypothetical protein Pan241w_60000 [Gimesia alba]